MLAQPIKATRCSAIRGWDVLRLALAGLLLTAAILKLAGRNESPMPAIGWFGQPWVQLAVIQCEIVLAVWLVSGWFQRGAWLVAIAAFTSFAGINAYIGWHGVASCACFGRFEARPWHVFALDAGIVLLAGIFRPHPPSLRKFARVESRRVVLQGAGCVLGFGGVLAAAWGAAVSICGSTECALARLRGETLFVSPSRLDFGAGDADETLVATVVVHNLSDRPIRLVGGTSDCSCVAANGLPCTIPPRESRTIPIQLKMIGAPGSSVKRSAVLWTDDKIQRVLRLSLRARVNSVSNDRSRS